MQGIGGRRALKALVVGKRTRLRGVEGSGGIAAQPQ